MEIGATVRLLAFGSETIVRRVAVIKGDHVGVCKEEEYQQAAREGRPPLAVGFPLADVIEEIQPSGA